MVLGFLLTTVPLGLASDLQKPGLDRNFRCGLVDASGSLKKQTNTIELTLDELKLIYDYLDKMEDKDPAKYEFVVQAFDKSIYETKDGAVKLDLELLELNSQQISKEMGFYKESEKKEGVKQFNFFFAFFDITGVGVVMPLYGEYPPGTWIILSQFHLSNTMGYIRGLIGGTYNFNGELIGSGEMWLCRVSIWDVHLEPTPSRIKGFCFSINFLIED